jgi:Domain of unknown function (DUF1905)
LARPRDGVRSFAAAEVLTGMRVRFDGEVWLNPGDDGWHFVTLPTDLADEIRARSEGRGRPFGSLAVRAMIGTTTWSTSLFADTKSASYLLPIKADVRRRERIDNGDIVGITVELAH